MVASLVPELYETVLDAWCILYDEPTTESRREWINLGYWDGRIDRYEQACDELAYKLADFGGFSGGDEILDVGCGTGTSTRIWSDYILSRYKTSARFVGLNITPAHVARANQSIENTPYEKNISFAQGDATCLSNWPADCFDKVGALECAFHFNTRQAFLREAYRVLKSGGTLAAADIVIKKGTPTFHQLKKILPEKWIKPGFQKISDYMAMPLENQIKIDQLREQLEAIGYKKIKIKKINQFTLPFNKHYKKKIKQYQKGKAPCWMPCFEKKHFKQFKNKMDFTVMSIHLADYILFRAEK